MASAIEVGLLLKATADMAGAEKAIGGLSDKLGGIGGAAMGASKVMGGAMLAGGAAVVGLGVAALKLGSEFEGAYNTIRAGTGATGKDFDALKEDFKSLASSSSQDLDTVASTMADLNTATGLVGEPLQALTKQFLDLQQVGMEASVSNVTRLFGDWGVATEDQAGAMDKMLRISQATGVGIDELTNLTVSRGADLRQFGGTWEENAAMLARWQKEGVNTETVMGGLSKVVVAAGKDGVGAAEKLNSLIESVQGAGSQAEAFAMVQEVVGAKLAANFLDTIQSGKFDMEEFNATLAASTETIGGLADATKTPGEKFAELKNNIKVALEPIGAMAVDAMGTLMTGMMPIIEQIKTALAEVDFEAISVKVTEFVDKVVKAIGDYDWAGLFEKVGGALEKIGDVIGWLADNPAIAKLLIAVGGVVAAIAPVAAVLGPLLPILGAVAGVLTGPFGLAILGIIALFLVWKLKGDEIKEALSKAFERIKGAISGAVDGIKGAINGLREKIEENKDKIVAILLLLTGPIGALVLVWREKGDEIKAALQELADKVREWVDGVREKFEEVKAAITERVEAIKTFLTETWQTILTTVTSIIENIRVGISRGWGAIKTYLDKTLGDILTRIKGIFDDIRKSIDEKLEAAKAVVQRVWDGIKDVIDTALEAAKRIVERALDVIKGIITTYINAWKAVIEAVFKIGEWLWGIIEAAKDRVADGLRWLVDSVIKPAIESWKAGIKAVLNLGAWIGEKIAEVAGEIIEKAKGIAGAIIEGLKSGLEAGKAALRAAIDTVVGMLPEWVRNLLGIASPSRVFVAIGGQVAEGLALGIESGVGRVKAAVEYLMSEGLAVQPIAVGLLAGRQWAQTVGRGYGQPPPPFQHSTTPGGDMSATLAQMRATSDALERYIRTAGFGAISGNQLADWMRQQGFGDDDVEDYRNLHRMREGGRWKTRAAKLLHRRRTVPTGGDWTGAGTTGGGAGVGAEIGIGRGEGDGMAHRMPDAVRMDAEHVELVGKAVSVDTLKVGVVEFKPTFELDGAVMAGALANNPRYVDILIDALDRRMSQRVSIVVTP